MPVIPFIECQRPIIAGQMYDHLYRHTAEADPYLKLREK